MMKGKIIKGIAGFYYVAAEDGITYACRARGLFRLTGLKPCVGDLVSMEVTDTKDLEGNVTEIFERKNLLVRPPVANVDQALVVFAMRSPDPNLNLLDSFIAEMMYHDVSVLLCFNKADMDEGDDAGRLLDIYRDSGCRVFITSAQRGVGIDEIKEALSGKTTVLAGPSGVGKSSIMNIMAPDADMETGDLSRKLKRGKNTTRHSQLMPIGEDSYLIDTPGFTSFFPEDIPAEKLENCYREFIPYIGKCYFSGCAHVNEPDCAVKDAVEAGKIVKDRYESYKLLYRQIKESERKR